MSTPRQFAFSAPKAVVIKPTTAQKVPRQLRGIFSCQLASVHHKPTSFQKVSEANYILRRPCCPTERA
jgi:hypothetical protein